MDAEVAALRAKLAQRVRSDDIGQRRRDFDAMGQAYPVATDVAIETVRANGVPAEWTTAPDSARDRCLLFLHGGGYIVGSLNSHRHMVSEIGRAARARTLALDYRLAPEHPFPAQVDDALAGYRFLLSQGISAGSIAVVGDSAGGGLTVAALVAIRDAGLPQPACGWCISPWVDMEAIGDSMVDRAATDPTVQKEPLLDMARHFLGGGDPRSPLAAPIYADLTGIAPLLIQVGSIETLLDDALRLARVAGVAEVAVDLQIWPEMPHVWHIYHPELSAGRRAIEVGGGFIRGMMDRRIR